MKQILTNVEGKESNCIGNTRAEQSYLNKELQHENQSARGKGEWAKTGRLKLPSQKKNNDKSESMKKVHGNDGNLRVKPINTFWVPEGREWERDARHKEIMTKLPKSGEKNEHQKFSETQRNPSKLNVKKSSQNCFLIIYQKLSWKGN